jgi:hypothetical protein
VLRVWNILANTWFLFLLKTQNTKYQTLKESGSHDFSVQNNGYSISRQAQVMLHPLPPQPAINHTHIAAIVAGRHYRSKIFGREFSAAVSGPACKHRVH